MPDRILAFPFRILPSGMPAVVECESDEHYDQLIAVACLTVPGERLQVPTFGIADPAFVGLEAGNLIRHLLDFGPRVSVETLRRRPTQDGREELTLSWTRMESPQ